MAKHEGLALLTLLSLPMLAIPAQVQASEFATYNNLLFKIYYPSGWTVNQTGTVKQGNVTFVENATRPPQAAAMARVSWLPENMSMNSDLSHHDAHGWITTMINNDSYYLLGQRALVIDQTDGYNKQLTFATNVNGTTYEVSYVATIDHFLNHISQFNVMVASFNIHGHVPKLKASTSSQESNKTSSSQESSKTGNGATSPTSSYQAVKTPYVSKTVKSPYVSKPVKTGATKTAYRAQGASNGKKRTELTISASQNGPDKIEGSVTWVPVILSGRLTSGGSGVAGAMILFSCGGETCEFQESANGSSVANTDSGGYYSIGVLSGHKEKIEAAYDHNGPSASTIVK